MKSAILSVALTMFANILSGQSIQNGLIPKAGSNDTTGNYLLAERMAFYKVPAVTITIFDQGKIVSNLAYRLQGQAPIDTLYRFQAASISKAVTAVAVLRICEQYSLDLDRDINGYLKTWKVSENRFTVKEKVTIRRLLSHTAGTNVSGFGGYKKDERIPTLNEILNGDGNSAAIKVVEVPGKKYMYSGGGYMILQKLVEDLTGTGFADFMNKEILVPLGMINSTFELTPHQHISLAHTGDGEPYAGGYYVMPELAPAGLWTTAADLARFCMALQQAYDGKQDTFLSKSLVTSMLTTTGTYGLGLGIGGKGDDAYFYHGGRNRGYNNIILNLYKRGLGIVVLTNGDRGDHLRDEIVRSFAKKHNLAIGQCSNPGKLMNPNERSGC